MIIKGVTVNLKQLISISNNEDIYRKTLNVSDLRKISITNNYG